jgi:hypothetical protein
MAHTAKAAINSAKPYCMKGKSVKSLSVCSFIFIAAAVSQLNFQIRKPPVRSAPEDGVLCS